jgi:phospholipid/cholesterol/gamma-HCH transport system substrate-binding protein
VLVAGLAAVALVLLRGGGAGYVVEARFEDGSQLVVGNLVEVAGVPVGEVRSIAITGDGLARVTFSVDDDYAPLRRGVQALVRQVSQSGVANRYVQLILPDGRARETIPSGGELGTTETASAVEFDSVLNAFDRRTRADAREDVQGTSRQFAGRARLQGRAYHYLAPALSSSTDVFGELDRDTATLQRFLVDSSTLVGTLAERRGDLAGLVEHVNGTFRGFASQSGALADALRRLPPFMRRADTTFANLRPTLDTLSPLTRASRPVARRLVPYLAELRPLLREATPTLGALSDALSRPGRANDVIELLRGFPALAHAAVDEAQRNGKQRDGALPEASRALRAATPLEQHGLPYTTDLVGWLDDYATTGVYDALGAIARSQTYVNAFSLTAGAPAYVPLSDRGANLVAGTKTGQNRRCPGAAEAPARDGSNVLSPRERQALDCREADRAVR